MSWEGNFKFDEDGKIEDTYGYANERTWKLESFHIKTRYRHKITAETDENGERGGDYTHVTNAKKKGGFPRPDCSICDFSVIIPL